MIGNNSIIHVLILYMVFVRRRGNFWLRILGYFEYFGYVRLVVSTVTINYPVDLLLLG